MIDVKQWIDADEGDKNSELLYLLLPIRLTQPEQILTSVSTANSNHSTTKDTLELTISAQ